MFSGGFPFGAFGGSRNDDSDDGNYTSHHLEHGESNNT